MSQQPRKKFYPSKNVKLVALNSLLCVMCLPLLGCVGAGAQLMHIIYGPEKPAKCSELKEKRVAILVTAEVTSFGSRPVSETLERYVAMKLASSGRDEKISVVPTSEVERWKDNHPSDTTNLSSLGETVGADYVLHLQVSNYDIRFGKTLYKGHCDYQIDLYDVAKRDVAFFDTVDEYEFPKNGRPRTDTTAKKFESFYLSILADKVSRNFYPNDPNETVALESVQTR